MYFILSYSNVSLFVVDGRMGGEGTTIEPADAADCSEPGASSPTGSMRVLRNSVAGGEKPVLEEDIPAVLDDDARTSGTLPTHPGEAQRSPSANGTSSTHNSSSAGGNRPDGEGRAPNASETGGDSPSGGLGTPSRNDSTDAFGAETGGGNSVCSSSWGHAAGSAVK
jgi:hypothetical protein